MLFLTSVFGAALYFAVNGFSLRFSNLSAWLAIVFAVVMIPYYTLSFKALTLGSVAIYSTFMMLGGMLLPFLYGTIWLKEPLSWGKAVGCAVLCVCIVAQGISQKKTENEKNKGNTLFFLLCLCIFIVNGLTGVIAKAHQTRPTAVDEVSFTVLSCLFTALLSLFLLGVSLCFKRKRAFPSMKTVFKPTALGVVTLLGAAMHTGNFLILIAAASIPASVQFPLISGGTILLSALLALLLFKEKPPKKEWFCIFGAFLSSLFFAF
ncbi:MAG: hypothetical protein IJV83_02150 [Clostridia bacterium]|nr:hypothetical protein [Clostridia bacterium]